jgi:uncharacterized membrane protein YvbJ
MSLKEFWKDINQPTDKIKTKWFRKGIVILTSPIVIVVVLIGSVIFILSGNFNSLDEMWYDFKTVFNECWKGPTT